MKANSTPPAWLDEVGTQKFTELAGRLAEAKKTYDADTLALLAAAWSRHLAALAELQTDGVVIRSGERCWNHPAASVASASLREISKLSKALALDTEPEDCRPLWQRIGDDPGLHRLLS